MYPRPKRWVDIITFIYDDYKHRRCSFDKRLWWNFQVMSLSCKLFVVSFINTALLTLLTYANFTGTLSSCTFGRVSDA